MIHGKQTQKSEGASKLALLFCCYVRDVTPNRGHLNNPGQRELSCAVNAVVKAWEAHLKRLFDFFENLAVELIDECTVSIQPVSDTHYPEPQLVPLLPLRLP